MRDGFVSRAPFFIVLCKALSQYDAYFPVSVLVSTELRDKWSFKNQSKRLFFGTNKLTASDKSCHAWLNVKIGGFDLQSMAGMCGIYWDITWLVHLNHLLDLCFNISIIKQMQLKNPQQKSFIFYIKKYLLIRCRRATISLWIWVILLGITSK